MEAGDIEKTHPGCVHDSSVVLPQVEFFEGAEKLLEVWFVPPTSSAQESNECSLRRIPKETLQKLLDLVNCTIVSSNSNKFVDSYVLSESSLFVWDHRFILKTCGTTTLLPAIPALIQLASEYGLKTVDDIFFSRKSFKSPGQQHFPHNNFENEVVFLDKMFDNGGAYTLGRLNGDCWHLYTLLDKHRLTLPADQTLEILMSELPRETMACFYKDPICHPTAKHVSQYSGISDIFPDAVTDEVMFDPCGYSVNGLLGPYYFTIHVTPQPECSYVSFETNVPREKYQTVVEYVLSIFKPGVFTVTIFANEDSIVSDHSSLFSESFDGYVRKDRHFYEFPHYNLSFAHFSQWPKHRQESVSR
eukprot:Sdes_comp19323_c0_seq1m10477